MTSPNDPAVHRAAASLERTRSRWPRVIAYAVGVALIAAAVWSVTRRVDMLAPALDALRAAPASRLALAALLPIISVALTSLTFWILTSRHGRVGLGEMLALINAAWLLNYLPLWPGMFGRLTYHAAINGIPLRDTVVATIWANALALISAAGLLLVMLVGSLMLKGDDWRFAAVSAAPPALLGLLGLWAYRSPPRPDPEFWRIPTSLAVRWVELLVWAARYSVCFALIGAPIGFGAALAFAAITGLGMLIPLTGNALGVREWIVGLAAPLLPVGLTLQTSLDMHTGLTADLTNRAIEVLLAVPVGIIAAAWVARRVRTASRSAA